MPDPARHLPLKPADFHILLALWDADRHGYGLMQHVAAQTDGQVALELGSLYRLIARLEDSGLLAAARSHRAGDDPRRRYYRLTALGRQVARAEARRLAGVVRLARRLDLLEGTA